MNILKKIFTSVFTKIFFLLLIVGIVLGLFFYWGWFEKQYYKAVGVYYVYKGDKEYKQEHLQKAIDYYIKGLELYPEHYGAQFNLGNIYVVYEDYYSATDAYKKAIEYNKNFTLAKMNLGIISAEKLGDFDEAINQYQSIINSKRFLWFIPFVFNNKKSEKINKGLAYYNLGVAYRQKALYQDTERNKANQYLEKAIVSYEKAAKILKDDYDTRYNLALTYHLTGNYQDAGKNYCSAINIAPMNYEAHYNLAILLRHLRMYKESLTELEKSAILISDQGVSNISIYIFDILNDVSRTLVNNNQYQYLVEKVDGEKNSKGITYVNGKIVATEALDRAMLKNFKTCENKDYFNDY